MWKFLLLERDGGIEGKLRRLHGRIARHLGVFMGSLAVISFFTDQAPAHQNPMG
jgi:hypothetical protein